MRIIEAVVRQRNYSRAGRELNISHAAVSQAIKRFETLTAVHLFERVGQEMVPSQAALDLATAYATAAHDLQRSLDHVLAKPDDLIIS